MADQGPGLPAPGDDRARGAAAGSAMADVRAEVGRERWELLRQLDALLDGPMVTLSFVWLGLLIVDLTAGLSPLLSTLSQVIWAAFALHFALGIVIAPSRLVYLRRNWLTALALLLPAFRTLRAVRAFRLLRAARAARSVTMLRLITTVNRAVRAISRVIGRRGVGYVVLLTLIVTFGGAAGMAQFESPAALGEPGAGLDGYAEALWWTAMTMTTMGSDYFPRTLEGRVLGWLLALYAFTVFGYITATIASLFLAHDAAVAGGGPPDPAASASTGVDSTESADSANVTDDRRSGRLPDRPDGAELAALRSEVGALRRQVQVLTEALVMAPPAPGRPARSGDAWADPAVNRQPRSGAGAHAGPVDASR